MRKILLLVVVACALVGVWFASQGRPTGALALHTDPGAPDEAEVFSALLGNSPVVLYSIQPGEPGPGCENKVLGSVRLTGKERETVAGAVRLGIEQKRDKLEAGCFNPHHGMVIDRVAFIICYQCLQVYCWKLKPGEKVDFNSGAASCKFLTTGAPAEVLNRVLSDHRVVLGKS
ncbi:hypothetical protein JST97_09760 [bacterium]|nr:hypothetical protein [bacterium]